MKFRNMNCPDCGEPAIGTVESIPGIALFGDPEPNGEIDHGGETKVCWEGQTTNTGMQGGRMLTCGEHEWEGDEIETPTCEWCGGPVDANDPGYPESHGACALENSDHGHCDGAH